LPVLEISSPENPLVKEFIRLARSRKHRRSAGKLAVEGPNLLEQALAAGLIPEVVFYTAEYGSGKGFPLISSLPREVRQLRVTETVFTRLAATEAPQAVAALIPFQEPDPSSLLAGPLTLAMLLDRLQDPGNMGTVLRTAAAAGVDAVFYTPGSADPFSPKVLRASAGAFFHIRTAQAREPLQLVESLKRDGIQAAAALPQSDQLFWEADFKHPTLLMIGNESSGISADLSAAADCGVTIPQAGQLDSLNAAVAAGILIYEAVRQRRSRSIL
jgi:RNA methyltransferase, TrmH family